MDTATLGLAAGAGMVAALNPCGFALLPAYLSLLVLPESGAGGPGGSAPAGRARAVLRALALTATMTLGFVVVFAAFGLLVAPLASSAQRYLPWVTVVTGVAVLALGGWLAAGRELPALGRRPRGPVVSRGLPSMFLFGVSYALASLTCTVAPFLATVVVSFRAADWLAGTALFLAYALGMGAVVGVAAVAVAVANASLVRGLRRTGRWVPRSAGALLLVVGAYVAYYGWWEIRVLRGGAGDDPVVEAALGLQRTAVDTVQLLPVWAWLALLAVLVLVVLGLTVPAQRRDRPPRESR